MIVGSSGIIKHVSVVNSGLTTSLHLWNKDGRDESMLLTRLPNSEGAISAKVSVIRSLNENEPIQIIVDKSADTWSRITRTEPAVFPVMVERDIRSFSTQTTINGSSQNGHATLPGIAEGDIQSSSAQTTIYESSQNENAVLLEIVEEDDQSSSAQTSIHDNLLATDRSSEMPQTLPAASSMQDERDLQSHLNRGNDDLEELKHNGHKSRLKRFLGKMKCL